MPNLSVSLITRNEEANLGRCLESVRGLAQEIVVVDSGSTDGTRAIADASGALWLERPWPGFRLQKNAALAACTGDWVLCLDADEALSPELQTGIKLFLAGRAAQFAGAEFARRSWFMDRWIRHGDWYPDRVLRLFRREAGSWAGTSEHTKVRLEGALARLPGDLLHWPFPDARRFVEKQLSYAESFAARAGEEGRQWSVWDNTMRPVWRLFRGYALRGGFLDGFPGLWIAVGNAYATFVRYSLLRRSKQAPPR